MLPEMGCHAIAKADCFCVRPNPSVILPSLLLLQLGSHRSRTELTRNIRGATRPRINTQQLRELTVVVPPLAEQQAIVTAVEAHLGRLGTARVASKELARRISALEQSALAAAFRGELVPQDPNDEPADLMLARMRGEAEKPRTTAPATKPKRAREKDEAST